LQNHLAITCGKKFSLSCALSKYQGNRKGNLQTNLKGIHGAKPSEFSTFGSSIKDSEINDP